MQNPLPGLAGLPEPLLLFLAPGEVVLHGKVSAALGDEHLGQRLLLCEEPRLRDGALTHARTFLHFVRRPRKRHIVINKSIRAITHDQ